jgi:hypothetical protein
LNNVFPNIDRVLQTGSPAEYLPVVLKYIAA